MRVLLYWTEWGESKGCLSSHLLKFMKCSINKFSHLYDLVWKIMGSFTILLFIFKLVWFWNILGSFNHRNLESSLESQIRFGHIHQLFSSFCKSERTSEYHWNLESSLESQIRVGAYTVIHLLFTSFCKSARKSRACVLVSYFMPVLIGASD